MAAFVRILKLILSQILEYELFNPAIVYSAKRSNTVSPHSSVLRILFPEFGKFYTASILNEMKINALHSGMY